MLTPHPVVPGAVIDSHVHVFPPHFVSSRDRFLARDRWFELLDTNPRAVLATTESLIETMDRAGVSHAVLCGFPWHDSGLCREHNAYMAESAALHPGRMSWLGIVQPQDVHCESDAIWCLEHGAAGLGEFNADAQGFVWHELSGIDGLFQMCAELDRPVLLHASEAVGHSYPGKGTATPDRLLPFLERHPTLRVIAAHWGGGLPFFELMPEVAVAAANVVYDSAASTYLYRPRVFRSVIDVVGPERVLFGSDFPVLRMERFVQHVMQLDWANDAERDAVMFKNAERILGITLNQGVER
jgi:predicted TIM-barrel fold metal-dependent hydrolase